MSASQSQVKAAVSLEMLQGWEIHCSFTARPQASCRPQDLPHVTGFARDKVPAGAGTLIRCSETYFDSLTVVFGFFFACFFVTYRPVFAERRLAGLDPDFLAATTPTLLSTIRSY
jgi:hypothetical protein